MLLNIIVPTYNRPAMLAECLTSLQSCTVPDTQVLIADDHSEQATSAAFEPFVGDGKYGYIWRRENLGALRNVTEAMKVTHGKYICIVPDDDSVNPGNFERKVDILESHPGVNMVYSRANIMTAEGKVLGIGDRQEYTRQSYIGGRDEFRDLLSGNWIYGASVVFRRTLFERYGYQDQAMPATLGDWDCWLRYARAGATAFINEPLVNTRLHDDALSEREKGGMAMGMVEVWRKWLVTNPTPPVIDSRQWRAMYAVFANEVARLGTSASMAELAFAKLQGDYHDRLGERFHYQTELDSLRPEFEWAA